MYLKDYYKTLELEPSATLTDIKKAYRRLAQQYHPDKNNNEIYATSHFNEIKEAYEVLSNPSRKEQYLQQKWYQDSLGKKRFNDSPLTPPVLLKQFLELDKYVFSLDAFRMDREGLYHYIVELLSDTAIEQLKKFNETSVNREIARIVLRQIKHLPQTKAENLCIRISNLFENDNIFLREIQSALERQKRKARIEKYRTVIILLAVILICILIYLAGR